MSKIKCSEFYKKLVDLGVEYFTGVPDSTYKSFISYISNQPTHNHRIAANEGSAISHSIGYHLATGKVPVVYMQNSGLGNAFNPLTSLADSEVYSCPMILMIGWRGKPGEKDEPQHKKMGRVMLPVLKDLEIPFEILDAGNWSNQLKSLYGICTKNNSPVALIVQSNIFDDITDVANKKSSNFILNRESVIKKIVLNSPENSIFVATTGKIGRELFEVRDKLKQNHEKDFCTVGGMGHASAIALELSIQSPSRTVYLLDGDGAAIMHMGNFATIGFYKPKNLMHILLDNQCHESTGGQPTISESVNFEKIAQNLGYSKTIFVNSDHNLKKLFEIRTNCGPVFSWVMVSPESRKNLGRPTSSPVENKTQLMNYLGSKHE